MLKFFATEVTVSKGANNAPALKFSDKGDFVRFRIGAKVYDARADKNHRWVNLTVKAFGPLCERIRKMDLKEGSHINLCGRYDEDVWEDETNTKKSMPVIMKSLKTLGFWHFSGLRLMSLISMIESTKLSEDVKPVC